MEETNLLETFSDIYPIIIRFFDAGPAESCSRPSFPSLSLAPLMKL